MSPYVFKILRLAGGAIFSISITGLIANYMALAKAFHSLSPIGWAVAGLVGVAGYILCYFRQISQTDRMVGIYMSVGELKRADERLAKALRIQPYDKYYRQRKEDDAIRESLKTSGGVVILGQPFSGKTRAALEAAKETDPNAYIMSFTSPEQLTSDKIKEIFLPCFLIFFAKPAVILFLDDVRRFAHCPFDELWARLRKQCSRVSILATCRSGVDEKTLAEGEIQQLTRGLRRVELGPLDSQARSDIYYHIWNEKSGPLGVDMSLPGLIISGPQAMRDLYKSLPTGHKRIVTALGLARSCGAEICERALLNKILKNVLGQDLAGIDAAIAAMIAKYVVVSDEKDRLSVQHDEFVIADYGAYYPSLIDLKSDLRKLESLPAISGNAERLLQLGFYYWNTSKDLEAARRALASSLAVKPSVLAQTSLARLYLWLGEPESARTMINAAADAAKEEDKKAVVLTLFADEILFRLANGERAAGWYALAMEHAQDPLLTARIAFRQGDCLVRLKRFAEAEPFYRTSLAGSPKADQSAVTTRLILAIFAQGRTEEATQLLRKTWESTPQEEWLGFAMQIVENGEGFFVDAAAERQKIFEAVWEEYSGHVLKLPESDGISVLTFASTCLLRGYAANAVTAYRFLIDQPKRFHMHEIDVLNSWFDLGAGLRDCQKFAEARIAFGRAKELAEQHPARKNLMMYVFAGLADCDLFERGAVSAAAAQYRQALDLANEYGDENASSWARMGLGDVAVRNGEFAEAKANYSEPKLILNSVSGMSRINLGLARSAFELDELDDAEFYIASGLVFTVRLDYHFRRIQFDELSKRLAKKRESKVAAAAS